MGIVALHNSLFFSLILSSFLSLSIVFASPRLSIQYGWQERINDTNSGSIPGILPNIVHKVKISGRRADPPNPGNKKSYKKKINDTNKEKIAATAIHLNDKIRDY